MAVSSLHYSAAIVAVIFDFDDTLAPDSTSAFLESRGVDVGRFWTEDVRALVDQGFDPALAYLNLLLEMVGPGKALGSLTEDDLTQFGSSLDDRVYRGLPQVFRDLGAIVREFRDISVEFYVISGGLEGIIRGCRLYSFFNGVYASSIANNPTTGMLGLIRRCVTFTEKTRYLFEISKGIRLEDGLSNPYLVNEYVAPEERRILFRNMIYVGDGLTDIPCFSLLAKEGGIGYGVFQPQDQQSAKRAFENFLAPKRVAGMYRPRYRPSDELGALLRATVSARCGDIVARRARA